MSGGNACMCEERDKPVESRQWIVYKRHYNTSAFNGGHYTPSAWSSLQCKACGWVWRTKAAYVARLQDGQLGREGAVGRYAQTFRR